MYSDTPPLLSQAEIDAINERRALNPTPRMQASPSPTMSREQRRERTREKAAATKKRQAYYHKTKEEQAEQKVKRSKIHAEGRLAAAVPIAAAAAFVNTSRTPENVAMHASDTSQIMSLPVYEQESAMGSDILDLFDFDFEPSPAPEKAQEEWPPTAPINSNLFSSEITHEQRLFLFLSETFPNSKKGREDWAAIFNDLDEDQQKLFIIVNRMYENMYVQPRDFRIMLELLYTTMSLSKPNWKWSEDMYINIYTSLQRALGSPTSGYTPYIFSPDNTGEQPSPTGTLIGSPSPTGTLIGSPSPTGTLIGSPSPTETLIGSPDPTVYPSPNAVDLLLNAPDTPSPLQEWTYMPIFDPTKAEVDFIGEGKNMKASLKVGEQYTRGLRPTVITETEYEERVKKKKYRNAFYPDIRYRQMADYDPYFDRDSWYELLDKWIYEPNIDLQPETMNIKRKLENYQKAKPDQKTKTTKSIVKAIKEIKRANPLGPQIEQSRGDFSYGSWMGGPKRADRRSHLLAQHRTVPLSGQALNVAVRGALPPNTEAENRQFNFESLKAANEGKTITMTDLLKISNKKERIRRWRNRWTEDLPKKSEWDEPLIGKFARPLAGSDFTITRKPYVADTRPMSRLQPEQFSRAPTSAFLPVGTVIPRAVQTRFF